MSDSQKFIARNRAPRVQIEYDVELYGSQKKVQLPFVMGVMSDLAGESEQPPVADRAFLEIDVDNFDDRMAAMAPRASFTVPNTLTGDSNIAVDLTFERMADFTPDAIARKVEPLRPLLEAREELSNLMAYMDGKSGAEALIEKILNDPALLAAVADSQTGDTDHEAVLDALRDMQHDAGGTTGQDVDNTLAALRKDEPDQPVIDTTAEVLGTLAAQASAPVDTGHDTGPDAGQILSSLSGGETPQDPQEPDRTDDILGQLSARDLATDAPDTPADTSPNDALETLRQIPAVTDDSASDDRGDILETLRDTGEIPTSDGIMADDILDNLDAPSLDGTQDNSAPDATQGSSGLDARADRFSNDLDDSPAGMGASGQDDIPEEADDLDALMSSMTEDSASPDQGNIADDDLDSLLSDLEGPAEDDPDSASVDPPPGAENSQTDFDAFASVSDEPPDSSAEHGDAGDDLDALLTDGDDDLDSLLADLGPEPLTAQKQEPEQEPEPGTDADDLDALLGDLTTDDAPLDDILSDIGPDEPATPEADDLDALLADLDSGDDLEDMLNDIAPAPDSSAPDSPAPEATAPDAQVSVAAPPTAFGHLTGPGPDTGARRKFRMAVFGDFTGRAARGVIDIGDALAARKPIPLDVDTAEDVIESFATTLVLPVGKDDAGIEVRLGELDDLHPDALFDNVEMFQNLAALKQRLGTASMAQAAAQELTDWGAAFGTPITRPRRARGTQLAPDRKLSDFQNLIGDTSGQLTQASPMDDLIAQIVGPHIVKTPDADTLAMQAAVDEAMSAAMRLVLHHPDFQAVEAQWRSIDLLAHRIETDEHLEIVLFDISAEELAADLASGDDLRQSALCRLLAAPLDPEEGETGFSAMFGLYTFEETPPHAHLLGRLAQIAAHVDAPFFTAISPALLEMPKAERHKLVIQAWDDLRALPAATHLGIATPRFMLRHPYGTKTDPIGPFAFEEFTPQEGLSGLLWANPVIAVAILMAMTHTQDGRDMSLGSVMSLGDIPFHFVTDRHGDQVALPCTERSVSTEKMERIVRRGFMPLLSMKGRNEIRLGSFQSVAGTEIQGPWSGERPAVSPPPPVEAPSVEMSITADDMQAQPVEDEDQSLDDLLAGFTDTPPDTGADDDMDPELAALLEDL